LGFLPDHGTLGLLGLAGLLRFLGLIFVRRRFWHLVANRDELLFLDLVRILP